MKNGNPEPSANLLAVAVGIKQKEIVDRIVKKVPQLLKCLFILHYLIVFRLNNDH